MQKGTISRVWPLPHLGRIPTTHQIPMWSRCSLGHQAPAPAQTPDTAPGPGAFLGSGSVPGLGAALTPSTLSTMTVSRAIQRPSPCSGSIQTSGCFGSHGHTTRPRGVLLLRWDPHTWGSCPHLRTLRCPGTAGSGGTGGNPLTHRQRGAGTMGHRGTLPLLRCWCSCMSWRT